MSKNTQITRDQAVALFIALGFNTAPKWKDDRLLTKLGQVKSKVDESTELDDAGAQETLNSVLANTGEFELISDSGESTDDASEKKSRRKKSKVVKTEKKASKAKKAYTPTDKSKSNKAIAYKAWLDGEDDAEKIHKLVNTDEVQLKTVRLWISNWKRGKNLPAIAKELADPSKRQAEALKAPTEKTTKPAAKKAKKTPVKKAAKKAPVKKTPAKKTPAKKRVRSKKA